MPRVGDRALFINVIKREYDKTPKAKRKSSYLFCDGKPDCVYGRAFAAIGVDFSKFKKERMTVSSYLPDGPDGDVEVSCEAAPFSVEEDEIPINGCSTDEEPFRLTKARAAYGKATVGEVRKVLKRLGVKLKK